MDTIDLAHKLAYAGARSPVPFTTRPEFTNSVPGVPVLAELRVFVPRDRWSEANVFLVAREMCRVLGAGAQFDIGITQAGQRIYDPDLPAAGDTARLMKLDAGDPRIVLLMRGEIEDRAFIARFPRLHFEAAGEDEWRSVYGPGAVKEPTQL
ncbi:MAG TPA: hypothetical protein VKX16_08580 [Chloroflexota bacterium]|nr:hypothetical protein [Chloroflexota bacterium]